MAKKKKKDNTLSILLMVAIAGLVYYLFVSGKIGVDTFAVVQNQTPMPDQVVENKLLTYMNEVYFDPNTICITDKTMGYINTNINGGVCTLYSKNGDNWETMKNINLNSNGDYSEETSVPAVGVYVLKVVCCDESNNCKISNEATLTANNDCVQQQQIVPSYCCTLNGQTGCYEGGCPQGSTQNGGAYELPQQCMNLCSEPVVPQATCTDSDYSAGYPNYWEIAGTCTINGIATPDSCTDSTHMKEYACEPLNNPTSCGYTTVNCPGVLPGSVCEGGKCVVKTCSQICDAQQGYSTGACFTYNTQGAMSMAQTCANNNGDYLGLIGGDCDDSLPLTPEICCCR